MDRALLALSALVLGSTPLAASTYSAQPAAPASERIIARNIIWHCSPAACRGATEESRPTVLCQGLARRAGRLESFAVNGRAFGPAELERCNAAARKAPPEAIANAR